MPLTSPDGTPIVVRPIEPGELDRIPLRCWPQRDILDRLFAEQEITIQSQASYSANVQVDSTGYWQWSPPEDLETGEH